jgi:hypothetical protein
VKTPLQRALIFAASAVGLLLPVNFFVWGGPLGFTDEHWYTRLLVFCSFHIVALALATFGASAAFAARAHRLPSPMVTVALGVLYACSTFVVIVPAYGAGGLAGAFAWLIVGPSLLALAGSSWPARHGGSQETPSK